jgi:MoCo/4Fe-4S cofactor protein with predicted Tat translocation signal
MSEQKPPMDIGAVRARLEGAKGREYWRCLEELAETDGFQDMLHREFPRQAGEWEDPAGRRNFLKLMGASLALAGLGACTRQPVEFIMPYVTAPEQLIPGVPQFYATAVTLSGVATGVLMESHMGRPTKVEGNPQHPASLGSTDAITQASVLTLYDPDRSQSINYLGEIRSFASFLAMAKDALRDQIAKNGSGIRILTETITSPSLGEQIQEVLKQFPSAKWHQYEPLGRGNARDGAKLATGQYVNTMYKFDQADIVLSLDSDFLTGGTVPVRYARDFSSKRKVRGENATMNRLYAIETSPTATGGKADHRLPLKPSLMASTVRQVAAGVGAGSAPGGTSTRFLTALVADLNAHKGSSIVIAGDDQTPEVHALAHAMNAALGNVGKTVFYTDPIEVNPVDQLASLKELLGDLDSGAVDMLFILGGNPVYNAPPDLYVSSKFQKAKMRVHLGLYNDETAEICQWHIPESHALEAWGDARAYDGTVTIMQPLIAPLYGYSKSTNELLGVFTDNPEPTSYELVRAYWQKQHPGTDFETWWKHSIHDGVIANSALPVKTIAANVPAAGSSAQGGDLEVSFHTDTFLYDGRFANNGWLMELPRPVSKLTWDNAALISPATAHRLGLQSEDYVELKSGGHTVWAAIWIQPGQPDDSIALNLGYGRTKSGRVGNGAGFNSYLLRTSNQLSYAPVELHKLGRKFPLASTQQHYLIDDGKGGELEAIEQKKRGILRGGTLAEYQKNPEFAQEAVEAPPKGLTIYPETFTYKGYAWGMVIDLTACTGCGTCTAACQAENNISVVGKEQVLVTREMHWIRVDRYYSGEMDNPSTHFQPVPCMQCENAPCEVVCPVAATITDQEGINNMVYNRCVGTRYCSNNCPYKVRRFNFMRFADLDTESLKMVRNPDVTVRTRGVMEKCTYCIQRISQAKISAEKQDRRVEDGEIVTACQAACPTQAITFGDINDPKSEVANLRKEKLNYGMLAELNTRPRTTYLAELRNPNSDLQSAGAKS